MILHTGEVQKVDTKMQTPRTPHGQIHTRFDFKTYIFLWMVRTTGVAKIILGEPVRLHPHRARADAKSAHASRQKAF
jgi:hypothetical protein